MNIGNLRRWHGENCKSKLNTIQPKPHQFF